MSHFIVGRVQTNSTIANQHAKQCLAAIGRSEGLEVRLLDGESDQVQTDILGAAGLHPRADAEFFEIVGDSGTADELISPYVFLNRWEAQVKIVADAISAFASRILGGGLASELTVVFSEGYDTGYELIEVSPRDMTAVILQRFVEAAEVSSLAIRLKQ